MPPSNCVEFRKSTEKVCGGDQMLLLSRMAVNSFDPLFRGPAPEAPAAAVHLTQQIENEERTYAAAELRMVEEVVERFNQPPHPVMKSGFCWVMLMNMVSQRSRFTGSQRWIAIIALGVQRRRPLVPPKLSH